MINNGIVVKFMIDMIILKALAKFDNFYLIRQLA
jgi:hypothetical protein